MAGTWKRACSNPEILNHDVGARNQPPQFVHVERILQISRKALLIAVDCMEQSVYAVDIQVTQIERSSKSALAGTFDLNNAGTHVRQSKRRQRPRKKLAEVVNVASVAGSTGVGSSMAYAAAKAGVITLTKSLARALAPEIRVNAISPGLIRTHFAGRPNSSSDFTAEEVATPLKRLATVDECAEVALFLARQPPPSRAKPFLLTADCTSSAPTASRDIVTN